MKILHHILVTTFDIVNRKTFFEELDDILEEAELLILSTPTSQPNQSQDRRNHRGV